MNKPIVIFLNGPPQSGKDTVAEYLRDHYDFQIFKFATPLRNAVKALTGIQDEDIEYFKNDVLNPDHPRQQDYTGRDFLIDLSELLVKPALGESFFGEMTARDMLLSGAKRCAVSDAGFSYEVLACAHALNSLHCPPNTEVRLRLWHQQVWRIHRPFHDFSQDSRSWVRLSNIESYDVFNSMGLDNLFAGVDGLVSQSLKKAEVA